MQRSTPSEDLPRLAEQLSTVEDRFDGRSVMGMLLMDLAFLHQVERRSGRDARHAVMATLAGLLSEVARERLQPDDMLLRGEVGHDELVLLVFRENRDGRFYRQELPGFEQALRRKIESVGPQAFYPHLRQSPDFVAGMGVGIRNPKFGIESQVWSVLQDARADAELNRRLEARERRRTFSEMLLDRKVFSVYEPIVEVSSRVVFGYESLARGPEGSPYHSPLALFGEAARQGMVFELDCLCRASGLAGAVDFPSGTKLFLNILPTTIHDPNFRADRLIRTLEESQLCPSDVVFEISEQEGIENFAAFKEVRDDYRSMGFQFALDDTGSGYAGLEALLEIQPEFIKVDRAFVSGVDQDLVRQDMLRALLDIADRTGARVIGEGLDTLEELEMLGELGIHFGQGWLFGKPTPLRARD